jgi:hypothetical protein
MQLDSKYRWYSIRLPDCYDVTQKPRDYVFRGITSRESRIYLAMVQGKPLEAKSYLLNRAVYGDVDWNDDAVLMGVMEILEEAVLDRSGLIEGSSLDEELTYWSNSEEGFYELMAVVLLGIRFNDLDTCDPADYRKYIEAANQKFILLDPQNRSLKQAREESKDGGPVANMQQRPDGVMVMSNTTTVRAGRKNKKKG